MESYNYQAWTYAYMAMAAAMLIGVVTTLFIAEPDIDRSEESKHSTNDYLGFLALFAFAVFGFIGAFILTSNDEVKAVKDSLTEFFGNKALSGFLIETGRLTLAVLSAFVVAKIVIATQVVNREMVQSTYVDPIKDFFVRYGMGLALLLLALIGLYRISDIVLGVIANVFYQDLGYTKTEIASIVKTFGLFMTIAGGFLGGILSIRYGVMKTLFLGAILVVLTNLLFVALAKMGHSTEMLYVVISADNISGGLASAAFIAFLSSLTNIKFTAVQYAIFSSLMTLLPKIIGGYSGSIVDSFCSGSDGHCLVGYENFFIIASLIGLPVLVLVWLANKHLDIGKLSLKT